MIITASQVLSALGEAAVLAAFFILPLLAVASVPTSLRRKVNALFSKFGI